MYKQLREQDPIHLAQTKEYIVTRYDDVKEILKSKSFGTGNRLEWLKRGIDYFENKDDDFTAIYEAMNSFILMLNPPEHQSIRTFINRSWNDHDVDLVIEKNILKTLSSITLDEIDVVKDFAQPLPVLTICDILGIDVQDHHYLKELGITMTKSLDLYISYKEMVMVNDAAKKFVDFFKVQIANKTITPDNGLLSKLIQDNKELNAGLSERQLISIGIFLFIAGQETLSGLISNGIYDLLKHPEEFKKLKDDPDLIVSSIEEILRFDSTVQLLGRIAKEDYKIRGIIIPAGSAVTLVIGSANRDEEVFSNPNKFQIERSPNKHLSFGSGIHFCLGDWLARRQAQLGISAFSKRFPDAILLSRKVNYYKNLAIRSLNSLSVKTAQV
jgi:cytochrome P450